MGIAAFAYAVYRSGITMKYTLEFFCLGVGAMRRGLDL